MARSEVMPRAAQSKPQFDLRSIILVTALVSVGLAWCTTFGDVLGSTRRMLPWTEFQYLILACTLALLFLAYRAVRCPSRVVSAMCLIVLVWQFGMLDAVLGMIDSFRTMGAPRGSEIYENMYIALVRALSLPFFGTLLFLLVARAKPAGDVLVRRLLIASITFGLLDITAILLCNRLILKYV